MTPESLKEFKEIEPPKRKLKVRLRHLERVSLRHAHRFIIRRLANLRDVRRHALGWLLLVAVLSGAAIWQTSVAARQFTAQIPAEGGMYTEGVFGALDNINPLFAATPAEHAASRLLFASLLKYDENGDLIGDLAQSWKAEDDGRAYSVQLRTDAKWQDGKPITAADVIFTFNLIKDADTKSPLYASWRNIGVEQIDQTKIKFTLPVPYAAFANSLTIGMLPQHILKDVPPSELRTEGYNRAPKVASGPFAFGDLHSVDLEQKHYLLQLAANPTYFAGAPKLSGFQLHAYKERDDLAKAFSAQEVASFSDASVSDVKTLPSGSGFEEVNSPLYNGVYAFLKTDSPILSDYKVRQALQLATDSAKTLKKFNGKVESLDGPLLPGQLGYRADVRQPALNLDRAKVLLDEAGWLVGADGKRQKDGQPLKLRLVTPSTGDYPVMAEELMSQWRLIGVEFDAQLVKSEDIQQSALVPRGYDVLLYEIVIGRDPDVYAYWHSSQATERGLNLSNYKSPKVDDALDSARTRLDPALREAKYRLFVQQWLSDVPAIGLYRPSLLYIQNKNVVTFNARPLVDPADRYLNVRVWSAGREMGRPTR